MVECDPETSVAPLESFKIKDIDALVQKLAENYSVYIPVSTDDYIEFKEFSEGIPVAWDFQNSTKSPKGIIFPQTEEMFKYHFGKEEGDFSIELPSNPEKKVIILGIRPCDVHAITKVDHNFKGEFIDKQYIENRKNTMMIGLACNDPCFNCFCTSMGGGPHSRDCMHALIIQTPETNIIEVHSLGVKVALESASDILEPAPGGIEKQLEELEAEAEGKIKRKLDFSEAKLTNKELWNDKLWEEIAERCIGCGICVFVCPTCRCFDIQDEAGTKTGRRIRTWDTCQFPEYTIHASGYNPRPARLHRVRNRLLCRVNYTNDKFGVQYCTGCGRCITQCPTNIDIFENFEQLITRIKTKAGEKERVEACAADDKAEVKN